MINPSSIAESNAGTIQHFGGQYDLQHIGLQENENDYIFSIDAGKLKTNELQITVRKNMLLIASTNDTSHLDKITRVDDHCHYEMHQLNVSFALPSDADANMARANHVNGKLSIYFQKQETPYRPEQDIKIKID